MWTWPTLATTRETSSSLGSKVNVKATAAAPAHAVEAESSEEEDFSIVGERGGDLHVLERSNVLNGAFGAARIRMGGMKPLHSKNQTKVHEILRVFDLSYEYGPCVGVSRLERWERAQALGLNPPVEVHKILMTKQGSTEDQYKQNVLYDEL